MSASPDLMRRQGDKRRHQESYASAQGSYSSDIVFKEQELWQVVRQRTAIEQLAGSSVQECNHGELMNDAEAPQTKYENDHLESLTDIRGEIEFLYHGMNGDVPSRNELPPTVAEEITAKPALTNQKRKVKYSVYHPTAEDVDELVDIDMASFSKVYANYGDKQALREELEAKFRLRLQTVDNKWVSVFMRDGKAAGFMMSCPTDKSYEEFESWEKTTDNGTLQSTYNPDGKNVYIVTLSMLPEGSRVQGQNMLFANQIGTMISEGKEQAFFESRLPGLKVWVESQCRAQGLEFESLTDDDRQEFAQQYFNLKTTVKGKEVAYDRLIRLYESAGNVAQRLVADAYLDEPSMNFGVIFTYDNPLPKWMRCKPVNKAVGFLIHQVAKSHALMQKIF